MLSSRLVLPERYGPHSATTRCAPLPGLPPVMVSDLMSFMTTSSLPRVGLRLKAPDDGRYGSRPERSLVLEIVSPWPRGVNPQPGEDPARPPAGAALHHHQVQYRPGFTCIFRLYRQWNMRPWGLAS